MLNRRGGNWLGGQHLAIVRALAVKPNMLILDESTERIQLSTIQKIIRVIRLLVDCSDRAILLPEQYYDFAKALVDDHLLIERSKFIARGSNKDMQANRVCQIKII